jgi:hypothetical protein
MSYDFVKPKHYKSEGKETWEMMIDIWGEEAFINFCELSAFKYRMRAGKKPGQPIMQELEKAIWYEEKITELRNGRA